MGNDKTFTITKLVPVNVTVKPKIKLEMCKDQKGRPFPRLSVSLFAKRADADSEIWDCFCVVSKSFENFLACKNGVYVNPDNYQYSSVLLQEGIAIDTGLYRISSNLRYPMWIFDEDFLSKNMGEEYQKYCKASDDYMDWLNGKKFIEQ